MQIKPGHIVAGRYEIKGELGRGGMGVVYRALNIAIDKPVALKVLSVGLAADAYRVQRFLNEGIAASRARHPAIIDVFDAGVEDGVPWMALELLEGEPLRSVSKREGPLAVEEAVYIMLEVLGGLAAAHSAGIVHRDVKPDNIYLAVSDGDARVQPKLLDFGIAKLTRHEREYMTATGAVMGTAFYLSPEQAESSDKVDAKTDIYAAGVTLFELLSGRFPYEAEGFGGVIRKLYTEQPQQLAELVPGLPEGLAPLVMRCLSHDTAERPSAAELARRLAELVDAPHFVVGKVRRSFEFTVDLDIIETLDKTRDNAGPQDTGDPLADAGTFDLLDGAPTVSHQPRPGDEPPRQQRYVDQDEISTSDARPRKARGNRVALLVVVVAALALATWACILFSSQLFSSQLFSSQEDGASSTGREAQASQPAVHGEPVVVGWPPAINAEIILNESEPLRIYLEEQTGRPIRFVMTEDYTDLMAKMGADDAMHFGVVPPLVYVKLRERLPGVVPIALREFDGATDADSILLVRRESGYTEVEQLAGKVFCMPDRNSESGYFKPRVYLRSKGWDPDKFIGRVQWGGGHHGALLDLQEGKCDVAATYTGAWQTADQAGVGSSNFRQIAVSGAGPHDIIAAVPSVEPEVRQAVQDALIRFDPMEVVGQEVLGVTRRMTGFGAPVMEPYEELYRLFRAERGANLASWVSKAWIAGGRGALGL